MRKITLILALAAVILLAVPAAAADTGPTVIVNGVALATPAVVIGGSTYIPLRAVGEALGTAGRMAAGFQGMLINDSGRTWSRW